MLVRITKMNASLAYLLFYLGLFIIFVIVFVFLICLNLFFQSWSYSHSPQYKVSHAITSEDVGRYNVTNISRSQAGDRIHKIVFQICNPITWKRGVYLSAWYVAHLQLPLRNTEERSLWPLVPLSFIKLNKLLGSWFTLVFEKHCRIAGAKGSSDFPWWSCKWSIYSSSQPFSATFPHNSLLD